MERVIEALDARNLLDQAVFVAHAGMPQQRVETDLRRLRGLSEEIGYLSTVIVQAGPKKGDRSLFPPTEENS